MPDSDSINWGGYLYRDRIEKKIRGLLGITWQPSEKELKQFNKIPLEAVNDSLMIEADTTISILFLGNSLTYTGVPLEEPDKEKRGLTSTHKENDYVHKMVCMIADRKRVNVKYSMLNICDFERTFVQNSFPESRLYNVENRMPDYLVLQIGENVSVNDIQMNPEKYRDECVKLLSLFPKSKKIMTLPFWPYVEMNYLTTSIAIEMDALIVDLSHLGNGTDESNFAYSQKHYKNPGVGKHPGDIGMGRIADCMYAGFQVLYDSN